jgi:hypothetical protein
LQTDPSDGRGLPLKFALRSIVAALLLIATASPSTAVPVDGPWHPDELAQRLNANLVLNGSLAVPQPAKPLSSQIAPCWNADLAQPSTTDAQMVGNQIVLNGPAALSIRPIQYYFEKNEPDYTITLSGKFPPGSVAMLGAAICAIKCADETVQLTAINSTKETGTLPAPPAGSYVRSFRLTTAGIPAISGLSVSRDASFDAAQVLERDRQSVRMCVVGAPTMSPPLDWRQVGLIGAVNVLYLAALGWLLAERAFFPLFIAGAYYLTNVFGLPLLYFGMSQQRMLQGVTDRGIITEMAWFNLAILIAAAVPMLLARAVSPLLSKRPALPLQLDMRLVAGLFVLLNGILLVTHFQGAIRFYMADASDASNASFIRNLIVANGTLGLKSHYFFLLFRYLPIFLSLLLAYNLILKRRYWLTALTVVVQAILLLQDGEKAPFVWYLYACAFMALTIYRVPMLNLMAGLGGTVIVGALAVIFGPPRILILLDRMLFGGMVVTHHILATFPAAHPFLKGSSMTFLDVHLTHGQPFNLAVYMWRQIFPERFFSDLTGTAAGAFWTQVYANFGTVDAIASAAALALLIAVVYLAVRTLVPAAIFVPTAAWLVFDYSGIVETDFTRYVGDFNLLGIALVFAALAGVSWLGRRYFSRYFSPANA